MPLPLIDAIRRNHALEHATIALLRRRVGPETRISGRSTPWGFYIYGEVPTPWVEEAAREALARLQRGEGHLAVNDLCGTNFVVGGILAALFSALAMGRERALKRLPQGVLAALGALLLAQPLGRWAQRNLTTSAEVDRVDIKAVLRGGRAPWTTHQVKTGWD